ncbi:hypothetical protein [Paenibacillus alginolyticus]|uniref:Uncharacterized protein n=1 Tax=Paenibacillus alginolyticus TaxID=59839 RepID=A0ABT4G791_9BACL|nr:hypothetical protein [Paenibacillus alginolyticus]MCY9692053.1 hypothetical protein [Paenibacillus alginolyticus]MEC0144243.1 hypothetical protein [Paenibacillus alginolyticus]
MEINEKLSSEDLKDPMKIEMYSSQLFENGEYGSIRLRDLVSKDMMFLFQNKWIGLPLYAQVYAKDWANSPEFLSQLGNALELCRTLEEATEALLSKLRLWGKQVAADFVGAYCLLEAQAQSAGGNDEIIKQIRETERSYAGYIALQEKKMELSVDEKVKPGEGFYIAQPLLQNVPGFMSWLFSVIDVALINRRPLIQDALTSSNFNEVVMRTSLATTGAIEDSSLLCAYLANQLGLSKYYEI